MAATRLTAARTDAVRRLRLPVPRGERDRYRHGQPAAARYRIVNTSEGEKIAFVGETLQGTPLIVTPTGVAGLNFLDEADTIYALVPRLKQRQVSTIVLLLHEGGTQNAPFSQGSMNVNQWRTSQVPTCSTSSTGSILPSTSSSALTPISRTCVGSKPACDVSGLLGRLIHRST